MLRLVAAISISLLACTGDAPTLGSVEAEVMFVGSRGLGSQYPAERVAALGAQLSHSDAGLVCLTGVWGSDAREEIVRAAASALPYSLALPAGEPPPGSDMAACSDVDALDGVLACLRSCTENGDEASPLLADACLAAAPCANDVNALAEPGGDRCRQCVFAHARSGDGVADVRNACTSSDAPRVHQGAHGLLLLSRFPLSEPSLLELPGQTHRRAVIGARATTETEASVAVFCATLGQDGDARMPGEPLPGAPYAGPHGDAEQGWRAEHELQVDEILDHVRTASGPVMLLGNFGASRGFVENGETIVASAGEPILNRLATDFTLALPEAQKPFCTICPSQNPLAQRESLPDTQPTWQNRIYVRGMSAQQASRRHLGLIVDVVPADHLGLTPVSRLPLSAQYAYRVHLSVP